MTDPWSTDYFEQLATTTASCSGLAASLPAPIAAGFAAAGSGIPGATACGLLYQAQSQMPGEGPCYAVWAESVEFMNRWAGVSGRAQHVAGADPAQAGPEGWVQQRAGLSTNRGQ